MRGGGWVRRPTNVRSARRTGINPDSRGNGIGFSLVRRIP